MVERQPDSFEEFAPIDTRAPSLNEVTRHEARKYLAAIESRARTAGVPCETLAVPHASPHQAIIEAATGKGCDLIVMASHGRKGVTGELIGSETARVITNCKIPVLVYR